MRLHFSLVCILILVLSTSCNWYSAGSGLGSVVDLSGTKYKSKFYAKYTDSLYKYFPQYKRPDSVATSGLESNYSFLNLSAFYFNSPPEEIYYMQWEGTGFESIRFAYDITHHRDIYESTDLEVSEEEKQRIEKRFRETILHKLDSLIGKSVDKDTAIFVNPLSK